MNAKRKAYEEKLDIQLKQWGAQIDYLKAKADTAKAEAKADYFKTISAMQSKKTAADKKLQELRSAGDEVWEDIKTGTETIWGEIKATFNSAASKFK